jgi:hypothetical protein
MPSGTSGAEERRSMMTNTTISTAEANSRPTVLALSHPSSGAFTMA